MVVIKQNTQEKANLEETKINDAKTGRIWGDGNKLCPGKECRPHTQ